MARSRRPLTGAKGVPGLKVVPGGATDPAASDHPARWSRTHVRTVAVASGKGGVGKSNLAANLAVALGALGARVLLVDADFSQANLDLLLGVHPRHDISHVLSGEKAIEEILVPGPPGVRLVPAASGAPELADLDDYRLEVLLRAIGQLEGGADLVIFDTPSGVSRLVTALCLAADDTVMVTTPEMPAFSDAYALIKLLHSRGLERSPHLVVNLGTGADEAEETAHRIRLVARRFLRLEIDVWPSVPYDTAVPHAVRRQEPVLTAHPHSPSAAAYRAMAARLWSSGSPDPATVEPESSQRLEA